MSSQTWHSPVKSSNLPDKCPMTGANLLGLYTICYGSYATLFYYAMMLRIHEARLFELWIETICFLSSSEIKA